MPPRIATWLVSLFVPVEQLEAITGDMLEEFSRIAASSGPASARRWYWREALRTAMHFAAAGICAAPWSTAAAVLLGFLLVRYFGTVPEKALLSLADRYDVFNNHFDLYRFLSYDGLLICHTLTMLLIGGIVAMTAKGREMIATLTLGFIQTVLALLGFFVVLARTGHWGGMPLAWMIAFPAAVVAGGIAVRTRRTKPASARA